MTVNNLQKWSVMFGTTDLNQLTELNPTGAKQYYFFVFLGIHEFSDCFRLRIRKFERLSIEMLF